MVRFARAVFALGAMILFTSFVTVSYTGSKVCPSVLTAPAAHFSNQFRGNTVAADNNLFSRCQAVLRCNGLSTAAFSDAYKGYMHLAAAGKLRNKNVLAIIDFSKPSSQKRLFIINMRSSRLVLQSVVAHGQGSGGMYATQFSNAADSHQSSLGFYVTQGTYTGQHGYSLRLQGCEPGINSNAENRNIVLHTADYMSPEYISRMGFAGRSHGCPAVPEKLHRQIIDLVKNGTCLYIYHTSASYRTNSKILNR